MSGKEDRIRGTTDEARTLARGLIDTARIAALGVLEPGTGMPCVSRLLVATDHDGTLVALVSEIALHSQALRTDPRCSLLVGEPEARGDPLTHPRLTVQALARFLENEDAGRAGLRDRFLSKHPKSKLYIDFPDFAFVKFVVRAGYLNAGFGKAFVLTPKDLAAPSDS